MEKVGEKIFQTFYSILFLCSEIWKVFFSRPKQKVMIFFHLKTLGNDFVRINETNGGAGHENWSNVEFASLQEIKHRIGLPGKLDCFCCKKISLH